MQEDIEGEYRVVGDDNQMSNPPEPAAGGGQERIVYVDRIVEVPVEKVVYKDVSPAPYVDSGPPAWTHDPWSGQWKRTDQYQRENERSGLFGMIAVGVMFFGTLLFMLFNYLMSPH